MFCCLEKSNIDLFRPSEPIPLMVNISATVVHRESVLVASGQLLEIEFFKATNNCKYMTVGW